MLGRKPSRLCASTLLLLAACGTKESADGGGDATSSESGGIATLSTSTASTSSASTTMSASTTTTDETSTATTLADSSSGVASDSGSSTQPTSTGVETDTETGGGGVIDCGNNVWACGDGMDNDADGLVDLDDPECTGPCDDDEGSFQTGIPGDNVDCIQDCFFDGNSGQGDDGCNWNLACDPANPGEFIMCEYGSHGQCNSDPPNQSDECVMFCEQYTPPGCDCFGCCTVCDENGENCVDIFLNGAEECTFDNIEACTMCTSQIDICGNPCVPEECEVCFGQDEPPEGCGGVTCDNDLPCSSTADCPTDFFCYLDCCYPPPPG
jgi:hypothetical protein